MTTPPEPSNEMREFARALFTGEDDPLPGESESELASRRPNHVPREGHTPRPSHTDDSDMREFARALFTPFD